MSRFHVNENGKVEKCEYVSWTCPFKETTHLEADSLEKAYEYFNLIWQSNFPILATTKYISKKTLNMTVPFLW